MKAHNRESQSQMTPEKALQFLVEGNKRFMESLSKNRNLLQQINETTSEVICHYMNDKKCVAELQVETIKLEQI